MMAPTQDGEIDGAGENFSTDPRPGARHGGPEFKRSPNWRTWADGLDAVRRRYEAGNVLSLMDGLALCRRGNIPLPDWLFRELMAFITICVTGKLPKERGTTGNILSAARNDLIHMERFFAVKLARGMQKQIKASDPRSESIALNFFGIENTATIGKTWFDAYALASDRLQGTFAQGEPETMKDSYRKVLKIMKEDNPDWVDDHFLEVETREALGLITWERI